MRQILRVILLLAAALGSLYGESIERYEVDIVVEESGRLQVKEDIYYQFGFQEKHGIFRDIPFTVKVAALPTDLGIGDFRVSMDDSEVQWRQYNIDESDAGELVRVQIGSPSFTIHGLHKYTISYTVEKGVLPSSMDANEDAIRWNAIGTGWQIPINNIKINVHLPSSVGSHNAKMLGYVGGYGSKEAATDLRWIEPNQIEARHPALGSHEGYTIEISYPRGLLRQSGEENTQLSTFQQVLIYWHWPVLAFYLFYIIAYHKRYTGVASRLAVAPQYNPPEGLSVLQSGLVYDKFADNTDFSAAIVELAQKGYLRIVQRKESHNPKLVRTEKTSEKLGDDLKFLLEEILFKKGTEYSIKAATATSARELLNGFEVINDKLYEWLVDQRYMSSNPKGLRTKFLIWNILLLVPVMIASAVTMSILSGIEMVILPIFASIFIGVGLLVAFSGSGTFEKIFGSVFVFAGAIPVVVILSISSHDTLMTFVSGPYTLVFTMLAGMIYTYKTIGPFTQKGISVQIYLQGLELFMKRVKEDELRRWLKADPLYLEKLMPYAMLFGMVKHWLELYENLGVSQPDWFEGSYVLLNDFGTTFVSSATPPANTSSSGGYSGGGGFSGGGGGGGGGGSW